MSEHLKSSSESSEALNMLKNLGDELDRHRSAADALPAPKDIQFQRTLDRSFAKSLDQTSSNVLSMLNSLVQLSSGSLPESSYFSSFDNVDDVVYNYSSVVHVVDGLIERSDKNLKSEPEKSTSPKQSVTATPPQPQQQQTKSSQVLPKHLKFPRNLSRPQDKFLTPVDNSRGLVWRPLLEPGSEGIRQKYNAIVPLSLEITSILDPVTNEYFQSVPHPYAVEIQKLIIDSELPSVYKEPSPTTSSSAPPTLEEKPFQLVTTVPQFHEMLEKLKDPSCKQIAVDVEHNSNKSYTGIVCLIQISSRESDWVVDVLVPEVRDIVVMLNIVFTNPDIVKIFHGASSDIVWLQRDFGIYIVNLFDTYDVTKCLEFSTRSLAGLLEMFCSYTADKRYQIADWRIRPIPAEMLEYARSDTHFLHYIYDRLLEELKRKAKSENIPSDAMIKQVVDQSAKTSLKIYVHEDYDYESGTGSRGWRSMLRRWIKRQTPLVKRSQKQQKQEDLTEDNLPHETTDTPEEEYPSFNKWNVDFRLGSREPGKGKDFEVMRTLHNWRDKIAREEDDSTHVVMSDPTLMILAEDFESWRITDNQLKSFRNDQNKGYSRPGIKVNLSRIIEKRWREILIDVMDAVKRAEKEEATIENPAQSVDKSSDSTTQLSQSQVEQRAREPLSSTHEEHHTQQQQQNDTSASSTLQPSSQSANSLFQSSSQAANSLFQSSSQSASSLFQSSSQSANLLFAQPTQASSSLFGDISFTDNNIVASTTHSNLFSKQKDGDDASQSTSILSQINASFTKFPKSQLGASESSEKTKDGLQRRHEQESQLSVIDDDGQGFVDIDQNPVISSSTTTQLQSPEVTTTVKRTASSSVPHQMNEDVVQVRDIYPTKKKIKLHQHDKVDTSSSSTKQPLFAAETSPIDHSESILSSSYREQPDLLPLPGLTSTPVSTETKPKKSSKHKKSGNEKTKEEDEEKKKQKKLEKKEKKQRKKQKKEQEAATAAGQGDDVGEGASNSTEMMIVEPFDFSSSTKLLDSRLVKNSVSSFDNAEKQKKREEKEKKRQEKEKRKEERKALKEESKAAKKEAKRAAKSAAKEERKRMKKLEKKEMKRLEKENANTAADAAVTSISATPVSVSAPSHDTVAIPTQESVSNPKTLQNVSINEQPLPQSSTSTSTVDPRNQPRPSQLQLDGQKQASEAKDGKEMKKEKSKRNEKKKDEDEESREKKEKKRQKNENKKQKKQRKIKNTTALDEDSLSESKKRKRAEKEDSGEQSKKKQKSKKKTNDNKLDPSKLIVKASRGDGNKSAVFVD